MLIIAFAVTQITVIQPTKKLAKVSGPDLIIKNTAIKNGKKMQQKLIDDEKIINSEFYNLKISFFKTDESEPFYKFLSNKAIKNRLTISSIQKLGERVYKEAKKDNPEEFVIYENYKQDPDHYDVFVIEWQDNSNSNLLHFESIVDDDEIDEMCEKFLTQDNEFLTWL